jgi:hypothetical protein
VREGNGPAMMQDWRFVIPALQANKHHKYLKLTFQMLICKWRIQIVLHDLISQLNVFSLAVNGFEPNHVAFDMVHNRTVNMTGKKGHNNGNDLTNEHLNNNYKGKFNFVRACSMAET